MIQLPNTVPINITPCPIIEAIFEARFVSSQPWTNMPGLLYGAIRERYPKQVKLPLALLPEEMRDQSPSFMHLPLLQFIGENFLIQLGPRMVSLVTKPRSYPGWAAVRKELEWLITKVKEAGFVHESERIGVRYIDFFPGDVLQNLRLSMSLDNEPLHGAQVEFSTALTFGKVKTRLHITNGAMVQPEGSPEPEFGSVLDLDGWVGPSDSDLFGHGLERFTEVHETVKKLFFALLKETYLKQLNPTYP